MLIFFSLAYALDFTDAKKVFDQNASKIFSAQYSCEPLPGIQEKQQDYLYDINKDNKKDIVISFRCTKEGDDPGNWMWSRFGFMLLIQSNNGYRYFDTVVDSNFTKVTSDGTIQFYSLDSAYIEAEASFQSEEAIKGEANARARIVDNKLLHIERSYEDGKFFLNQNHNHRAEESFQTCLLADPAFHLCYWELGWVYWNEQEWDKTLQVWNKVLELSPTDKNAKKYIPKAQKKRLETAKAFWEKTWGYKGEFQKEAQKHSLNLRVQNSSSMRFVGEYTVITETSVGLRGDCEPEVDSFTGECSYVTKDVFTCTGKRTVTERGEVISFDTSSCPTLERRGHMCFMNDIRIHCSTKK